MVDLVHQVAVGPLDPEDHLDRLVVLDLPDLKAKMAKVEKVSLVLRVQKVPEVQSAVKVDPVSQQTTDPKARPDLKDLQDKMVAPADAEDLVHLVPLVCPDPMLNIVLAQHVELVLVVVVVAMVAT